MAMLDNVTLFLIILLVYFISVIILHRINFFNKYNISFYGPALLLRTKKGRGFLEKISQLKRFWKSFGNFGIFLCFLMMILMIILLAFQTWTVIGFSPEQIEELPGIEFGLVLPGINPILPLDYVFYIILALIIAVIVHEFSHGIQTFVSGLKVKSLGILYLIIPLGAFCEPDEEGLRKTKISNRMRVYSSGPTSNFTVVLICLILFSFVFMSAVEPIEGTNVFYVIEDSPAMESGVTQGSTLINLNDSQISNISDFYSSIQNTKAGQNVNLSYFKNGIIITTNVTLADRYIFTNNESHKNQSFLGIGFNPYGNYISILKNPFSYDFPNSLILLYALPFFSYMAGYNPIAYPFTDSLIITGPLSFIPDNIFWGIVNSLYWIFWINLAVGLFNVLPIIPLDGGFLFKDAMRSLIKRFGKNINEENIEKISRNISTIISLFILIVVLFPWIIRYF